jgi:hypothetical protein
LVHVLEGAQLDVDALRHRLHHQVRVVHRVGQVRRLVQVGDRHPAHLRRHLAARHPLVEVARDRRQRRVHLARLRVEQAHPQPRHGAHLGDPVPHRPRAEDADPLQLLVHPSSLRQKAAGKALTRLA